MILLNDVTKKFKDKTAVLNINLAAKQGELVGFLGPNGAGKTTTMRLLLGVLTPTAGAVTVFKRNPQENHIWVLKKIGYLPENNPLYEDMKVREYLKFIAEVKQTKEIDDIAKKVGLSEVLGRKIEELSRGFKQRVGLAAAMIGNPSILILDEPTSGLDPLEQDKIRALIKKLSRQKTIIFSTHMLSEVEDIANRLIIIHEGEIVFDGKKPKGKGTVEKLFKKLVRK